MWHKKGQKEPRPREAPEYRGGSSPRMVWAESSASPGRMMHALSPILHSAHFGYWESKAWKTHYPTYFTGSVGRSKKTVNMKCFQTIKISIQVKYTQILLIGYKQINAYKRCLFSTMTMRITTIIPLLFSQRTRQNRARYLVFLPRELSNASNQNQLTFFSGWDSQWG